MGLHPDGDPSGGFLKDGGSPTLDAWSEPIGYTLMVARVGQLPIRVFTLTVTHRGLPERQRLAHDGCSEPAYNGIYPDGHPSRSTAYTGLHPDGDPLGGFLKEGGLPTLDAQSQPIVGYNLMAVRAGQPPIRVFTLTVTPRGAS